MQMGALWAHLAIRLKATLSNQSMNQHGAVVPSSRLDARAVQGCLSFLFSLLQLDSTHLASEAKLQTCGEATAQVLALKVRIVLKSLDILNSGH